MEQFTAIEVRDAITWKYGDKLTRISAMLTAFADMLEAREIARNDAIEREYERENNPAPSDAERLEPPSNLQEALCVIENAALHGVTLHGDDIPRLRATVDRIAPAQQSQDAERLANCVLAIIEPYLDTGDSRTAPDWAVAIYRVLAAHSAQAQPPANQDKPVYAISRSMHSYYTQDEEEARQAEFDGANVQRIPAQPPAARVTDAMVNAAMRADFCGHNVADALMCGTDWNTEVMRAALEAALAAQENPNG